jgi:adenylosuccinate synthase
VTPSDERLVLAISGPIRAGKTTLAENVLQAVPAALLRTRDVLLAYRGRSGDRRDLQELGRSLDGATGGRWVLEATEALGGADGETIIVDAVRIAPQLDALRSRFGVVHVHLTAPLAILRKRWGNQPGRLSYEDLRADPTEAQVESLATLADLVVNTGTTGVPETSHVVLKLLRDRL